MSKWIIDPDHSVAAFKVRHLMVAHVRGQFNRLSGSVYFDSAEPTTFTLEVQVDTEGIYTGIVKRDEHLKSPDFLNVAANQRITFKSSGFEGTIKGGKLSGDLTIHGVTRPVTLDLKISGPAQVPDELGGGTTLGLTASTTIDREKFNMNWNVPLADGGLMVGREVQIDLDLEADIEE